MNRPPLTRLNTTLSVYQRGKQGGRHPLPSEMRPVHQCQKRRQVNNGVNFEMDGKAIHRAPGTTRRFMINTPVSKSSNQGICVATCRYCYCHGVEYPARRVLQAGVRCKPSEPENVINQVPMLGVGKDEEQLAEREKLELGSKSTPTSGVARSKVTPRC